MIAKVEVKNVLCSMVPSFNMTDDDKKDIYQLVNSFANYTRELIKRGNLVLVNNCFKTADFLLTEGSQEIKNSIENIYIFSLGLFLDVTGATSKQVKELLPTELKEKLNRQLRLSYP